jgi:arsenic resistance protein ArsH
MEEFVKYTILMRSHFDLFNDRYSEREEKRIKEEKAKSLELEAAVSNGSKTTD